MVNAFGILLLIVIIVFIYFIPSIIAFKRNHAYKNIILVLNIFGITWIFALIWAIFPSEKSLIDPVVGNVTGTGKRNVGDTVGEINYGKERAYNNARKSEMRERQPRSSNLNVTKEIEKLSKMLAKGQITKKEYEVLKKKLIN